MLRRAPAKAGCHSRCSEASTESSETVGLVSTPLRVRLMRSSTTRLSRSTWPMAMRRLLADHGEVVGARDLLQPHEQGRQGRAQLVGGVCGEVPLGREPLGALLGTAGQGRVEPVDLLDARVQRHGARVPRSQTLGALAERRQEVGHPGGAPVGDPRRDTQREGRRDEDGHEVGAERDEG